MQALGLNNQKLLGVPIIVQPSHAEKNRSAGQNVTLQKVNSGPMRLYVGSLHYNITEAMLRGIFEPFGKVSTGRGSKELNLVLIQRLTLSFLPATSYQLTFMNPKCVPFKHALDQTKVQKNIFKYSLFCH